VASGGGAGSGGRSWRSIIAPSSQRSSGPRSTGRCRAACRARNRVDGQHNRSYPGRTWPRVPSVRDPHQFPEPGAHGRIADGGGPGPRLTAHIRWSAAFDSDRRRAVCKTVGSAYVGSKPTPATTCGNGPLAADTRQAGRFLLVTPCIVVRHRESMRCGVHGRITDGVHAIRTVGAHRRLFHGRPRTGRAGGVFPGLTRGAESGVHPCVPAGALGGFPGRGAGRGRRMR